MNVDPRLDDLRKSSPERDSGRPSGDRNDDGLRPGKPHAETPTEAPETRGETPPIEHAPGEDL